MFGSDTYYEVDLMLYRDAKAKYGVSHINYTFLYLHNINRIKLFRFGDEEVKYNLYLLEQ